MLDSLLKTAGIPPKAFLLLKGVNFERGRDPGVYTWEYVDTNILKYSQIRKRILHYDRMDEDEGSRISNIKTGLAIANPFYIVYGCHLEYPYIITKILTIKSPFPRLINRGFSARHPIKEPIPMITVPINALNLYLSICMFPLLRFLGNAAGCPLLIYGHQCGIDRCSPE